MVIAIDLDKDLLVIQCTNIQYQTASQCKFNSCMHIPTLSNLSFFAGLLALTLTFAGSFKTLKGFGHAQLSTCVSLPVEMDCKWVI